MSYQKELYAETIQYKLVGHYDEIIRKMANAYSLMGQVKERGRIDDEARELLSALNMALWDAWGNLHALEQYLLTTQDKVKVIPYDACWKEALGRTDRMNIPVTTEGRAKQIMEFRRSLEDRLVALHLQMLNARDIFAANKWFDLSTKIVMTRPQMWSKSKQE